MVIPEYLDSARLTALAQKYRGSIPRYTSYPTAVEFSEQVGADKWREALCDEFTRDGDSPVSFYVHIPFCKNHCSFCACNSIPGTNTGELADYLQALTAEAAAHQPIVGSAAPVEQIHWGGGTPNFLGPQEIQALQGVITNTFPNILPDAELSFEADPRTMTDEHFAVLAQLGFNRLSIGVQDFSPAVQQAIHRVQPFPLTRRTIEQARSAGISNINIDILYGLPLQEPVSFAATLDQVIDLAPDRVALYGYAHVPWLRSKQKLLERHGLPSPEQRIALFAQAVKRFSEAGYIYIGLDHFALPSDSLTSAFENGRLNRTFMGYTTHKGSRLVAFGATAISMLPGIIVQNTKDHVDYSRRIAVHGCAAERGVLRSSEDQLRSEIIEGLLCRGRVDVRAIEKSWSIDFFAHFAESLRALQPLAADGLVALSSDSVSLTPLGRLFARNAACAFDEYLARKTNRTAPVFSQAV